MVTDDQAQGDGARVMVSKLTLEAVRLFLDRLPEEQRTILLLICVEGLAYRVVADLLDLPIGTVTSLLARARTSLRDFMRDEPAPPRLKQLKP